MMKDDEFYLNVAYALSGCQLVEQALKGYITEAFDLVRKSIDKKIPFTFRMNGNDFSKSTLGHLIKTFKNLNDNEELAKKLDQFRGDRNFLSHTGITDCLDFENQLFQEAALRFQNNLKRIQSDAQVLLILIHEEANRFRGYLWFDDVTIPNN